MRPDGIRVKDADPMYALVPYFLTKRYDAMNMVTIDIPVEPMRKYINEKRKEGQPVSHLGLVLAAYLRTVAEFPIINRFIGNKKVYQHNDFTVSMVVLRPETNGDVMSKIHFEMEDDVFTVQRRIDEFVNSNNYDSFCFLPNTLAEMDMDYNFPLTHIYYHLKLFPFSTPQIYLLKLTQCKLLK